MSRTSVVASAAVALVALVTSTAASSLFAGGGPSPDPFVVGGGGFGPGTTTTGQFFAVPRDFGVDSHVEKKASKTYGILRYGNNVNPAGGFVIDVSCVNVQENRASVGGTLRGSNPPQGWVMFFVDTGGPTGPKDQASPAQLEYLDPALQSEGFPGWPPGFPSTGTCPSPVEGPGATAYGAGFLDLDRGDVSVSAGSD